MRNGGSDLPVLLLKFPQLGVDIKCAAKIGLPLLMAILRQVSTGRRGMDRVRMEVI